MRTGLYYDLRNPASTRPWAQAYAAALERIGWADAEGIDAIWVTEHHGFADGYLPAPLTFCAAIAARTSQARVGTAVVISPLMPALALAEQAAVVDILSGGRLELGLGAGWRREEFVAFGADFTGRYQALENTIAALPHLWESGQATPPPVQQPLPVWVGARGPRGARLAGRAGAGLLWIDRGLLAPYLAGLAMAEQRRPPRLGGLANVFLADDPEAARAAVRNHGRHNRASYRDAGASGDQAAFPKLQIVTPAAAAAYVTDLCAGLPVTDVFCFGDIGGLPDDLVDRHTELVTRELRPLLATGEGGEEHP
jgi:alkanesulfonate monooxygenase SsuD/methylene tetrahydromethanopterin reductase-like flavin-dependent oxidoreductase (luciferase family)